MSGIEPKDKPGTRVLMMPADEALDYADRGLRLASRAVGSMDDKLEWWARKDFLTRTLMSNYVREKHPAGEALRRALLDGAQDWTIMIDNELQGQHNSIVGAAMKRKRRPWSTHTDDDEDFRDDAAPSGGGRSTGSGTAKGGFASREAKGKQAKTRGKGAKTAKIGALSSRTRTGDKLCGAFNSKKGCSGKSCPQKALHKCAIITRADGTVCFSPNHGAANHRH